MRIGSLFPTPAFRPCSPVEPPACVVHARGPGAPPPALKSGLPPGAGPERRRCEPIGHHMTETANIIIVGAGQAGLALSHELTAAAVDHTVLERGRVGETWRGRWNSFCLVIPNWTVRLPGYSYG